MGEGANDSSHGQRPWALLPSCLLSRDREGGVKYLADWPHSSAPPSLFRGFWRRFQLHFCCLVILSQWAGLGGSGVGAAT